MALTATAAAVAEAADVSADTVDASVEELVEEVSNDVVAGNVTLAAELNDVNATAVTIALSSLFNVSESSLDVQLSAGSVLLTYAISMPNCSAPTAEYDAACEGAFSFAEEQGQGSNAVDTDGASQQLLDDVDMLLANIGGLSEADFSVRLGVATTVHTPPRKRRFTRIERSLRINTRIRALADVTNASDVAAMLHGDGESES
eukprot:1125688-Prymnesium_polylepis.1